VGTEPLPATAQLALHDNPPSGDDQLHLQPRLTCLFFQNSSSNRTAAFFVLPHPLLHVSPAGDTGRATHRCSICILLQSVKFLVQRADRFHVPHEINSLNNEP
jgi:hypothetical protein